MRTYNDIKESVAKFLRLLKAETCLEMVEEFIELAEVRVYRNLRIPAFEQIVDLQTEDPGGFITLPANYLEPKAVVLIDGESSNALEVRPFEEIMSCPPSETGDPRFYARLDNMLFFRPIPDAQRYIRLWYYMQLDNLSEDNPVNYISDYAPDVLIYGALQEAAPYLPLENVPEGVIAQYMQLWEAKFQRAMGELEAMSDADYNGSRLVMRGRD